MTDMTRRDRRRRFTLSPARRHYIYNVAIACCAVVAAYMPTLAHVMPLWVDLIGTVLGISGATGLLVAKRHTP